MRHRDLPVRQWSPVCNGRDLLRCSVREPGGQHGQLRRLRRTLRIRCDVCGRGLRRPAMPGAVFDRGDLHRRRLSLWHGAGLRRRAGLLRRHLHRCPDQPDELRELRGDVSRGPDVRGRDLHQRHPVPGALRPRRGLRHGCVPLRRGRLLFRGSELLLRDLHYDKYRDELWRLREFVCRRIALLYRHLHQRHDQRRPLWSL